MYEFVRTLPLRQVFAEQLPLFAVSLVIAEMFYKFHSFTLEVLAFLATWYLLDVGLRLIRQAIQRRS